MNFEYETERLILKVLDSSYAPAVLNFLTKNKEAFEPYESQKPPAYYTIDYQTNLVQAEYNAFLSLKFIRYYAFLKSSPDTIIGTVSFYNILPSPYCYCTMGYKIDSGLWNMGLGTEMVKAAADGMFLDFGINRIEAYVMNSNIYSARLLESIGFINEGIAHKAIKINGIYRDHMRYAAAADTSAKKQRESF